MRHGKDVMVDKPGVITLDELAEVRRVQAETGRIFSVCFSERFENRATEKASQLVAAGAIGRVVQTVGLGPHALRNNPRPDWFFQRQRYGGILCDIAAHQCDQFLHFTGSTRAEVVASHIANHANPETPELEDFGEVLLRGNGGTGYIRVDWYTPKGLGVWGDGRLTILGTEGYIELRKYVDIAGRPGGDHLFLVDGKGTQHIDCKAEALPYGPRLIADVLDRTETAMAQAHCFLATELALKAEAMAVRVEMSGMSRRAGASPSSGWASARATSRPTPSFPISSRSRRCATSTPTSCKRGCRSSACAWRRPRRFADARWRAPTLDMVDICTPPNTHLA